MKRNSWKLALALLLTAGFLEAGLRLSGIAKTHSEKNFGIFINPFSQTTDTPFWLWTPNDVIKVSNRDFEFDYPTNSLGLVDRDVDTSWAAAYVTFVGDSFTQGSGAPADSSMPRLFAARLTALDSPARVLNAGIPASDVFFFGSLIEHKLLPLDLKRFVMCVNTSDLYDYVWRGGAERFLPDGGTTTRRAPWYFGIYRVSHLFRAFFHGVLRYDHSYMSHGREEALKAEAAVAFQQEIERLHGLIEGQGGELVVVLQPHPAQYSHGNQGHLDDWAYLEDLYRRLSGLGLPVINTDSAFGAVLNNENYYRYSWLTDQHFNGKGYDLYASIVLNALLRDYPGFLDLPATRADSAATN